MRAAAVSTSLLVLLTLSACSGSGTTPADDPPAPAAPTPAPSSATPTAGATGPSTPSATPTAEPTPEGFPELEVEVLADDLTLPWDVDELAGGGLLVTEKESGRILLLDGDQRRELSGGPSGLWSSGETGLMSIVVDPSDEDRFLTCHGHSDGGATDVRVVEWTLDEDRTQATEGDALITGIESTTGRHGGCRMEVSPDGELFVGTGDAAVGTNPRDLTSLNGKVLRADAGTGDPLPDNPFADSDDAATQLVWTYGHRNVQGLAVVDGTVWSAEHGPDVDDEVNRLEAGGDYGWDPVPAGGGGGYDESVPMTDDDLDGDQVAAAWSSGDPTLATSGMTLVEGAEWGGYAGGLAVATLKAQQMLFLPLDDGEVGEARVPEVLTEHGRLRSVTQAADGALLVTTSNGSDDELLRVTPRS
ncbi:PQQ-dependent sugar dehydrogenase [Auraticoccus monumenti]|uniref:Glucose/arabinose dehydrogenase, beta-propeller fold n=1 Tax=Auraticoccus monumenti TaxID=675864 RepID=A0A1G6TRC0_9ACTN|nr:PQQ-dependent sugar dehydrogenase [Auraticoccus monumenti]SDD30937.1 Glucose/arabinose dehydrogenase, beta-propeller fold [Auraticoccus monumenti]